MEFKPSQLLAACACTPLSLAAGACSWGPPLPVVFTTLGHIHHELTRLEVELGLPPGSHTCCRSCMIQPTRSSTAPKEIEMVRREVAGERVLDQNHMGL